MIPPAITPSIRFTYYRSKMKIIKMLWIYEIFFYANNLQILYTSTKVTLQFGWIMYNTCFCRSQADKVVTFMITQSTL